MVRISWLSITDTLPSFEEIINMLKWILAVLKIVTVLLICLCLSFPVKVMLAASYWSLLAPAIEMAETSGSYGNDGRFAFIPVSVGFILGAVFVFGADKLLPILVIL